ncbi:SDR family oxidoreductase [Nocardioides yefusunii]|uniref:SDR family oxidoreductase n=1 Tax=Nocardioides yefusunii TaxID=2500546 RepID=A0ABW1QSX4_9ACTN|nr:SDR family oxidoreductase [Nocardioides yefusunii]
MSTAVITGSTKGIGHAMAREFRRHGYNVVVSGRSAESVDAAVAELVAAPGNGHVTGLATDVSDVDAVQALWDHAVAQHGSVDVWINNAGVAHTTEKVVDTKPADVHAMVRTNMLGTIFGSQVALRGMTAQGSGKLFNVLGGGSDGRLRPGMGVYSATKRGLDMLTRALVKESKETPVLVGQIRPGILISDGWLREAQRAPEQVSSQRKALNYLSDHVDDVAPYLVSEVMTTTKTGSEISWLTNRRIATRFMTPGYAKKNDVMARYGL